MYRLYSYLVVSCLTLCGVFEVNAQLYNSPYSRISFGDMIDNLYSTNASMGGIGISNSRLSYVPQINPAQLSNVQLTQIDVSLVQEQRNKTFETNTETSVGTAIGNITLAFPVITGKLGLSIGLQPVSLVSFIQEVNFNNIDVQGYSVNLTEKLTGKGGWSSLNVASGINLTKNLSFGAKLTYLFGDINLAYSFTPSSTDLIRLNQTEEEYDSNISDVLIELGAKYSYHIKEDKILHFGLIYQFENDISTERLINSNLYTAGRFTPLLSKELRRGAQNIKYPSMFGIGFNYDVNKRWVLGFDFKTKDWDNTDFNVFPNVTYRRANSYHLGAEFVPQYDNIDSYIKRVIYRAGISYTESPYLVDNLNVDEIIYSVGVSFPVQNYSLLNLGFAFGTRGRQTENLITENFYRLTLGISFNDRWFVKRRLN